MGIFDEIEKRAVADGFSIFETNIPVSRDEKVLTFGFPNHVACLSITRLEQRRFTPEDLRVIMDVRYSHAKDMLLSDAQDREGTNG